MVVVDHLKEERKVGVISQVILVRGALTVNMIDVSLSPHTSRRMMETW